MTYAHITNDTIASIGRLPTAARRQDNGDWVLGLRDASVDVLAACGYAEVAVTDRPDDTATDRHTRDVQLIDGVPTIVWTAVPKTAEEQQAETDEAADDNERAQIRNALGALTEFIQQDKPSTAAARANAAYNQAVLLSRICRRLIRDQYGDES